MTAPHPRDKGKSTTSTTTRPSPADPTPATDSSSAPKIVAREGVPLAVRPDPHPGDGRRPVAWLHITAPGRGTIPAATSRCVCGRDRSAIGHTKVAALVADHTAHRDTCPRRTTQEGKAA
ncbi:hypothetical protein ACFWPV_22540 [Streptomyces uncialis]|uniref:hypothetical protein n=1 Tax=Streptomyces uncialis TaxID=1048205 RepID=UPI0036635C70